MMSAQYKQFFGTLSTNNHQLDTIAITQITIILPHCINAIEYVCTSHFFIVVVSLKTEHIILRLELFNSNSCITYFI